MTPSESSQWLQNLCTRNPVMPVISIHDPNSAVPLADTLVASGILTIEVTLRTSNALKAIQLIASHPACIAGAGTLITASDAKNAKEAGAKFGVSPGVTPELIEACQQVGLPLLPGAVTPTEIMSLLKEGFHFLKFFPAELSGGFSYLKAIAGPLPQVRFCPTGGITTDNVASYLKLKNVVCVGGSWIAPPSAIDSQDWATIEHNARNTASILTVKQ